MEERFYQKNQESWTLSFLGNKDLFFIHVFGPNSRSFWAFKEFEVSAFENNY